MRAFKNVGPRNADFFLIFCIYVNITTLFLHIFISSCFEALSLSLSALLGQAVVERAVALSTETDLSCRYDAALALPLPPQHLLEELCSHGI